MHEQLPPLVPTQQPKLPVVGDLPSGRPSHQGPATSSSKVSGPPAALVRPRTEVRDRLRLLSWSSSKTAPPPTSPCASTPRLPEGPGLPHPELVPPVSFFPTSAVCSAHGFAGLLHPAAGHGVRLVSSRRPTLKPTTDPPPRRPFPLRSSSAEPAGPCHQGPSLRAVGRAACRSIPSSSTSRSCFRSGVPPLGVSAGARAPVGFPRPRLSPGPTVTGGTCGPPGGGQLPGALVRTSG
jgi:hypothetical protein